MGKRGRVYIQKLSITRFLPPPKDITKFWNMMVYLQSFQGFTKLSQTEYILEELDSSNEKGKRKLKGARKEFKDTGGRRVLIAGICPEVPESSFNFRVILDKCQVDLTPSKVTGDLKGLNILWGVGPCSSAYPCLYCTARRPAKW